MSINDVHEFNVLTAQCPAKVNFCHPCIPGSCLSARILYQHPTLTLADYKEKKKKQLTFKRKSKAGAVAALAAESLRTVSSGLRR